MNAIVRSVKMKTGWAGEYCTMFWATSMERADTRPVQDSMISCVWKDVFFPMQGRGGNDRSGMHLSAA